MALLWAPLALVTMLGITLGLRHRASALAGSASAVALLAIGGLIGPRDVQTTAALLWRPALTITSVMVMTACAQHVGLFLALAERVEPATRGPVRVAFRKVFVLSALTAALLSNDAAILVLTPTIVTLLRTVYPRRHPKFTLPFSFAVFYSAGVAPLVTGNPMNVVVASHAGVGFNTYALLMAPVSLVGALVSYRLLAREFAAELSDEAPALGAWPGGRAPLRGPALVVVAAMAAVLVAYPIISYLDGPLWAVASLGAIACTLAATRVASAHALQGAAPSAPNAHATLSFVARETSWELLPFLAAVLLVAAGLAEAGVDELLAALVESSPAPLATMGAVSAAGAAVINNHPMAMLGSLAVERMASVDETAMTLAALVGGDLGPRILPIGSLAGLLWLGILRHREVALDIRRFVRVGMVVTVPTLAASLGALHLMTWLAR